MRVVSNTSPLSNLAIIRRLNLLELQFHSVCIPEAISKELNYLQHSNAQRALSQARRKGWLVEKALTGSSFVNVLSGHLDRGEAEAIALAMETKTDWLLMDKREGRLVARQARLKVTGALGILLKAKKAGHIESLQDEVRNLRKEARFFITQDLEIEILQLAGEA